LIRGVSDLLVRLQEFVSQYPSWMVAGAVGFAVVIIAVLLWKAMRVVVTALIVAVLVAVGWLVWDAVSDRDKDAAGPASQVAPAEATTPQGR
jgi:hypothetical protein